MFGRRTLNTWSRCTHGSYGSRLEKIKNCPLEEWRERESAPARGKRMTHRVKRGTETKGDSGGPSGGTGARGPGRRRHPFRACCIVSVSGPSGRETARRVSMNRWCKRDRRLSVIGNLYFCRPYLSSALTPCFCESQPMGHPDRLDRATRGRRAARRLRDTFNLCRHRGALSRWWPRHRHHRRFQSNLQCRVLRLLFASPPRMASREITPRFCQLYFSYYTLYNRSFARTPRECYSWQTRSRDCLFHRNS